MKPEVANALGSAAERLLHARTILGIGIPRVAAREAYLAAFEAVQGLIFQAEGKVAKTHSGARTVFHRLYRDWPPISPEAVAVLDQGFEQKTIADYRSVIDDDKAIRPEAAAHTLALAALLVEQITAALADTPQTD